MVEHSNIQKIVKRIAIPLVLIMIVIAVVSFFSHDSFSQAQHSYDVDFSVEYTQKANLESLYNEVWIKGFVVNGNRVKATAFGIPLGWEEYAGFLHAYGFKDGKSVLNIKLANVRNISLIVGKNNTSGILNITDGTLNQQIDLYSSKGADEEIIPISVGLTKKSSQMLYYIIFACATCILLLLLAFINASLGFINRIKQKLKVLFIGKIVLFSIIFAAIVVFGVSGEFPSAYNYNAEIVFTGDKSDISASNAVWVKYIIVDGKTLPAAGYSTPQGWEEFAGYLHCFGTLDNNKRPISLSFSNANEVKIVFGRDTSSGIAEIRAKNERQVIDLYGNQDITVALKVGRSTHMTSTKKILLLGLFSAISFIFLMFALKLHRKWVVILPIYLWGLTFVYSPLIYFSGLALIGSFVVVALSGLGIYWSYSEPKMKKYRSGKGMIGTILISVYCVLAFVGEPVILKDYKVDISLHSISYLFLLGPLMYFIVISVLYLFETIFSNVVINSNRIPHKTGNIFWLFFFIMAVVFAISIYIFAPGNVTVDNLNLIREARAGVRTIPHPIYYYWYVLLTDRLDPSQFLNIIIQSGFFCIISSTFLTYLCQKGLKLKIAIFFVVLFSIHPSNIIGQVTQVKDYMSATAILWLVFLVLKIIDQKDRFWTVGNVFQLFFALAILTYFRPNGAAAGYLSIILISLLVLKYIINRKKAFIYISGCIAGVAIMGLVTPLITPPGVVNNSTSSIYHIKLLIAENYSGILQSNNSISKKNTEYLEKFLTHDEWMNWYLPKNAQPFTNERQSKFLDDVDTVQLFKIFVESVIEHPFITIKNRLNKTNILWDVTSLPRDQLFFHVYIYDNELGIKHNDNMMYKFIVNYALSGKCYSFITQILMSCAIMLILLIITMFYLYLNGKSKISLMTLPALFNTLFIFIVCFWQDYRYYYFILPITFFTLLTAITYCNAREGKEVSGKL